MIPQSFIQELLNRVDIVDVVERHVPLKKAGANYQACCPFHSEKSPSFTVSPAKQFYHCFGCGAHGSAIGFLMEYSGLPYPEAIEELARQAGMTVPREDFTPEMAQRRQQAASLTEVTARAANFYRQQLRKSRRAIDYLKGRGLSGEIAARFGIGYAPDGWQGLREAFDDYEAAALNECGLVIDADASDGQEKGRRYDRFRDRIMFPIYDARNNVIGFGGRVLDRGEPKYLNSPETPLFSKGRELYGLTQARTAIRDDGFVLVVEGYMDVVALAQFGVGNAVATLGTATTADHIHKLFRQTDRIVFCFDGDRAGRKAAWRALESALAELTDGRSASFLFLPTEHDPDSYVREYGNERFRQQALSAQPLSEYLLHELESRCDIRSAEGRAQLVTEAKPLITQVPAGALRTQLLHLLAPAVGLSATELAEACGLRLPRRGSYPARAPAAAPRTAPSSPARKLLCILMQRPELGTRLGHIEDVDDDPWLKASQAIADCMEHGDLDSPSAAALIEFFRNTPHGPLMEDASSSTLEDTTDAGALPHMFDDTVAHLRRTGISNAIKRLTALSRQSGLTAEQQDELGRLLREKAGT
ncbi:MAG: DNA primase [Methyloversatilis sp.]|nr:DNA primase [Methyloversatilis sp.]MBP6195280.1 DNA primase [Methyloversatilis sp.]MBP9118661.1 DNA primase [Methyloversatilis sp.]